jgi:hypothetical protein
LCEWAASSRIARVYMLGFGFNNEGLKRRGRGKALRDAVCRDGKIKKERKSILLQMRLRDRQGRKRMDAQGKADQEGMTAAGRHG